MATDLNASQYAIFNSVIDGSMRQTLEAEKSNIEGLNQALIDAQANGAPAANIQAAQAAILEARQNLNEAINQHNTIAGWIQTATGQNIGLAGLGVVPAVVYTVAAIAGGLIALGFALDMLAKTLAAAQGKEIETKGYLEQFADVTQGSASFALNLGTVALLGFGAYMLFSFLKKKGTL